MTARSGAPSPFRSPTASDGNPTEPRSYSGPGAKLPSPLFTSTDTVAAAPFAVIRSGLPSAFVSAIATESGPASVPKSCRASKLPSPLL
jgi:hypothetical protein